MIAVSRWRFYGVIATFLRSRKAGTRDRVVERRVIFFNDPAPRGQIAGMPLKSTS
jgi:gentisate 1,2-dioxygenase